MKSSVPSRSIRRWFWILPSIAIGLCPLFIFSGSKETRPIDAEPITDEVTFHDPEQSLEPRKVLVAPNSEHCQNRKLFVGLHVRVGAFDIRQQWRDGVGQLKDTYNFCLVFAVGKPKDNGHFDLLRQESLRNEDVLIGDFEDTYHNLTHKNLMLLRYFNKEISGVPFFLKMDDDVAVNFEKVHKLISRESRPPWNTDEATPGPKIWCLLWKNPLVYRMPGYKNSVSRKTWSRPMWPNYCSGMAYITTQTAATALLNAISYENWLFIDDVLVTGVLAERAKIKHVQIKQSVNYKVASVTDFLRGKIMLQLTNRNETQSLFKRVNNLN